MPETRLQRTREAYDTPQLSEHELWQLLKYTRGIARELMAQVPKAPYVGDEFSVVTSDSMNSFIVTKVDDDGVITGFRRKEPQR